MKTKVSRLFAVTLLTPKRIVRSSLPWRDKDLSWGMGCGWSLPHLRASEPEPPLADREHLPWANEWVLQPRKQLLQEPHVSGCNSDKRWDTNGRGLGVGEGSGV